MDRRVETGTEKLLAVVDDGVLRLTLNNPSSFNSLTAKMLSGLQAMFSEASEADDVRAVLISGTGDRAFASGADIGEHSARAQAGTTNPDRGEFVTGLLRCKKPVVAMIHGYCLGGGLLVAMAADIRLAADDAKFGIPAARLGIAYPLAAVELLVDLVGRAAATRMILTGDRFDADAARSMGLVTDVAPKAELEDVVEATLRRLSSNAPLSMWVGKASIAHATGRRGNETPSVVELIDMIWASDDAREGMDAFFERRDPRFQGR